MVAITWRTRYTYEASTGVYRHFAYNDSICTTWVCDVLTTRFSGTDCIGIVAGCIAYVRDHRSTGTQKTNSLAQRPSPKSPQPTSATTSLTSHVTLLPCISMSSYSPHLYACSTMVKVLHSYSFYLHVPQHRSHGWGSHTTTTTPTPTQKHACPQKVTKTPTNVTKMAIKTTKMATKGVIFDRYVKTQRTTIRSKTIENTKTRNHPSDVLTPKTHQNTPKTHQNDRQRSEK